jgi:hypothetical protein
MVEPDNIVLEHLRAIRAKLDDMDREIGAISNHVAEIELRLSGLTHAVLSGFGSIVSRLDLLDARVSRLERERV